MVRRNDPSGMATAGAVPLRIMPSTTMQSRVRHEAHNHEHTGQFRAATKKTG